MDSLRRILIRIIKLIVTIPLKIVAIIVLLLIGFFSAYFVDNHFFAKHSVKKSEEAPVAQQVTKPTNKPVPAQTQTQKEMINTYSLFSYDSSPSATQAITKFSLKATDQFNATSPIRNDDILYISDMATITRYALLDKTSKVIYKIAAKNQKIQSLSRDDLGHLYVGLSVKSDEQKDSNFTLQEIDPTSGKILRSLTPLTRFSYRDIFYLFKADGNDILGSTGNDSYEKITKFKDGKSSELISTCTGCADQPRYVGTLPQTKQILLASVVRGSYVEKPETPTDPGIKYDSLYGQNVLTGEKETLYDLKKIDQLQYLKQSDDKKFILFVSPKSIAIFDLTTKTIVQAINQDFVSSYPWSYQDNELVGLQLGSKVREGITMNPTTGEIINKIALDPIKNYYPPEFLGKWQGKYLFIGLELPNE